MKTQLNDLDIQPWYTQGWPWALIAIPLLTVVAGVTTFMIANDTDDSLVQDDYYKQGLAINSNLDRVEKAAALGIIALIDIDRNNNLVIVKLSSEQIMPDKIELYFSHPTLKTKDQNFILEKLAANQYAADFQNLESGYWHVSLQDSNQVWLLKSRWLYPENTQLTIDASNQ